MATADSETKTIAPNGIELTNSHLRLERKTASTCCITNIPISEISYIRLDSASQREFIVLGLLCLLVGVGVSIDTNHWNNLTIAHWDYLTYGVTAFFVFLVGYFLSKRVEVIFASSGGEIKAKVPPLKIKEMLSFIEKVEEAKKLSKLPPSA